MVVKQFGWGIVWDATPNGYVIRLCKFWPIFG